jgi:hypothetical protein
VSDTTAWLEAQQEEYSEWNRIVMIVKREKGLVGSVNEKCKKWMGWEAKVCTNATAHLATDQTIRFQCLMLLLAKVVLVVGSPRIRAIP